jgi:hypothetical protein
MKKNLLIIGLIIILGGTCVFIIGIKLKNLFTAQAQEKQIQNLISERKNQNLSGSDSDPFGADNKVKILFIGLDNRLGETNGHCDAIQFIEIDRQKLNITITAVPRGTYAPLPGTGHQPTDYYVSKACEVGGLDYGVKQIEKILGQKADYVVFLGFSEAMGIFRQLKLPANETMQWLRLRQGYAIGEPQRARNHSNFIKEMIVKFTPEINSPANLPLEYLGFKMLRTDLSLKQAQMIAQEVVKIDLPNNPSRIQLLMRPAYTVQDIEYDPENLSEKMNSLIKPIADIIPEGAYTGVTEDVAQTKLLQNIENGLVDADFVRWAYNNYLWLQIEDAKARELTHYNILVKYIFLLKNQVEKDQVIADYIIEMQDLGQNDWAQKGKELLGKI